MNNEDLKEAKVTLELSVLEVKSLAAAAEIGMVSGKLATVFKSSDEDFALLEAMVKLRKSVAIRALPVRAKERP